MTIFLLAWTFCFQTEQAPPPKPDLWSEIARVEAQIKKLTLSRPGHYRVLNTDPVRGYGLERVGVLFLVPIRYMPRAPRTESGEATSVFDLLAGKPDLNKRSVERKVQAWQESLKRIALERDADFEGVVAALKKAAPDILANLTQLPAGEKLMLIVEEREPAWYFPGLRLKDGETRKVATLTIDQALIAKWRANKDQTGDLVQQVKRTTSTRGLGSPER